MAMDGVPLSSGGGSPALPCHGETFGKGTGQLVCLTYDKPLPMRLDRWLVQQRQEQSRARIQKFIEQGLVRVNGAITPRSKTPLRHGDRVEIWLLPPEPLDYLPPQPMDLHILYEDGELIVINKPAGLTVHPAPGHRDGTLVNGLIAHCPDLPGIGGKMRPGIVHRLDKDTSGCMVVAKSQAALMGLQRQIAQRHCSRRYLALVHGVLPQDQGRWDAPIGRHPVDRRKYAVVAGEKGKQACTHWQVLERLGPYSLVRFQLETGRTHQIRVHCSHWGHPILGDPLYSRCRHLPMALPGQMLHAMELGLHHPLTQEPMVFTAEPPPCFQELLRKLGASP